MKRLPGRWIGRGGPIRWPPRPPDLTPLDFCLGGWMNSNRMEVLNIVARCGASGVRKFNISKPESFSLFITDNKTIINSIQ